VLVLSDRERRTLARIERQLIESDPDLARLFTRAHRRGSSTSTMPTFLLVAGLALLVLGSIVAAVPVAVAGMTIAIFALFTAHARPTQFRRPGTA
jgi:hypothetical protein